MKPETAVAIADQVDPPGQTALPLALAVAAMLLQGFFTIVFCYGIVSDLAP